MHPPAFVPARAHRWFAMCAIARFPRKVRRFATAFWPRYVKAYMAKARGGLTSRVVRIVPRMTNSSNLKGNSARFE